MTYRSESRGILYTAPPSADDDATDETAESEQPTEEEREMPELDGTSATTDANWTGTVPADD
ncbi:hypothetical protein [Halorussus sp. MSC15.2]|uniref:hypothetical protein n=1 Tax=Halorussus sp. MSC15.2 TaxID=2283638 RepID=UPI0013D8D9A1|nr:hypothetical protein [Halorussus sp. MSC15.2]NEU57910.1 hypothetical protein [Halorussus sp. MSC15.2]